MITYDHILQHIKERFVSPSPQFKEQHRKGVGRSQDIFWANQSHEITGSGGKDSCSGSVLDIDWKDEEECHVKMFK